MSRRLTLIDDDERSRPSIPIRLNKTNSWMDNPAKPSNDDDSIDFHRKVQAVSRGNEQHTLTSHLLKTKTTVGKDDNSDGYKAESDDGADDASGEIGSIDAIRDNDDASADITSVGEAQTTDASVVSVEKEKGRPRINLNLSNEYESTPTISPKESLTPAALNGLSAFHKFTAEVSPDGPDLEVQLKEPAKDDTEHIDDRNSDVEIAESMEESEVATLVAEENEQLGTTSDRMKEGMSTRTWFLLALVFILIVAGIGAAIGSTLAGRKSGAVADELSSPTQSPETSPNASSSGATKCAFCFDGTVPKNLGNNTIKNSTSCLDFYNQLTQLFASDPLCSTGQALSWRYCSCPSLPPAPMHPSCTLCPNGTASSNTSAYCKELSALVAIVGSSRLSNCNDLRAQVLPTCSCLTNGIRRAAFWDLLSTISGLNNTENASNWQQAALNWISNEDVAQLPPEKALIKEIGERYVAALLFFATNGSKWISSANFLSPRNVCDWNANNIGVFCNGANELAAIALSFNNLEGVIPSEISILTGIVGIALNSNNLNGPLPSSLGELRQLTTIQVQNNALTSTVPHTIFESSSIQELLISNNRFHGKLPTSIGSAIRLHSFVAHTNALTGPVPASLNRLPSLGILDLENNFLSGPLPRFEASPPLVIVNLGRNLFSGSIPITLTNSSGLKEISLAKLNLTGTLPDFSSNNGSLVRVELFGNHLTGSVGTFVSMLPTSITSLELHQNLLTGEISAAIGRLTQLNELNLCQNRLNGTIPTQIGMLTQLTSVLQLHGNTELAGTLPTELGLLTGLREGLYIYSTAIHGTIPTELGRLSLLQDLALESNRLTGSIPSQLGNLRLLRLSVSNNFLTGRMDTLFSFIPTSLVLLRMDANLLNGTIPSTIGAFTNVSVLSIHFNQISGLLPTEVGLLVNLQTIFDVHGNALVGKIPPEIGNLDRLQLLDLGNNQFSSSLPNELGFLTSLTAVDLSGNALTGTMPTSFAMLPRLNTLLIFDNNITEVDTSACERLANISFFVANSCNGSKIACNCCTNCCIEGSNHCPAVGKHKTP